MAADVPRSTADQLRALLLGRLPQEESEALFTELSDPDRLEQTARSLAADDPLLTTLRSLPQQTEIAHPAELALLLSRLRQLSAPETPPTTAMLPAPSGAAISNTQLLYPFLAPAQAADELGRLAGYRVLSVLGQGGMGVVFLAEDLQLHRRVALKTILPHVAVRADARERFLREARAAARIEHEHLVPIFQVGEVNGVPFMAMPLLRGEPLATLLARHSPERRLDLPAALRIVRESARGLRAAHEQGLIHRDVKPANLWLETPAGRVKILDFGLARLEGDSADLTGSGTVLGTPAYMAPEQARGEAVDQRVDLFSLGCVLYELLTSRKPFRGETAMSIMMSVGNDMPAAPATLVAGLPPRLSTLTMRLLAKTPAERPASAAEVLDELDAIEAADQTQVLPPQTQPTVQTAARMPRWAAWTLAAAAAALVMLLAGLIVVIRDRSGKPVATIPVPPGGTVQVVQPAAPLVHEVEAKPNLERDERAQPGVADQARPFVVIHADGERVPFNSFTAAVNELARGSVLEIRGTGPFEVPQITLDGRDLNIRAAPGCRPLLKPARTEQPQHLNWFLVNHGAVRFEGLDFDCRWPGGVTLLDGGGDWWELVNCRTWMNYGLIHYEHGPGVKVRDCLTAPQGNIVFQPKDAELHLTNNTLMSFIQLSGSGTKLELRDNTFFTPPFLQVDDEKPNGTRVTATGNVFNCEGSLVRPADRAKLTWHGQDNLYVRAAFQADPGAPWFRGLEAVKAFWGRPEHGALAVADEDRFVHHWERLWRAEPGAVAQLVRPVLEQARRRHGMPDLGPDVEQVGPGQPYWNSLPKERQVKLAPVATRPVVLLRNGREAASVATLTQAFTQATAGDVIEVRADGDLEGAALPSGRGQVTLRAGYGYRPRLTLRGAYAEKGSTLSVEGIDCGQFSVGGDQGRLGRVAYCCGRGGVGSQFAPPDLPPSEILRCVFSQIVMHSGAVVVRESILGCAAIGRHPSAAASLEIDRCAFWATDGNDIGYGVFDGFGWADDPPTRITVRRSYIDTHRSLHGTIHDPQLTTVWRADHNVYAVAFVAPAGFPPTLAALRERSGSSEEGCVFDFASVWEPAQWALRPDLPKRPDGRPFGADVRRIGVAVPLAP